MTIERMLLSGATRSVGADTARLFTRKKKNANLFFIFVIALTCSVYGWLFLLRKRSEWWQRVLAIPMIIGGTVAISYPFVGVFAQSPTSVVILPLVTFATGVLCTLISNATYAHELEAIEKQSAIDDANGMFLAERGLQVMENMDLFEPETGTHFKRISTMSDGVLYSIVGRRGKRAKLSFDGHVFTDFQILEPSSRETPV